MAADLAHLLDVPLVYFMGTRPNWYRPEYPVYVAEDHPEQRTVLLTFGKMRGPYDEREPVHIDDVNERRYVVRQITSASIRPDSGEPCFPPTATVALSAGSTRFGCSMPPISSVTQRKEANPSCATG